MSDNNWVSINESLPPKGGFMVDCSECKNCYIHPVAWGEYWCRIKEAKTGDGWVYDVHSLKKRFKDNCEDFIKNNIET